LKICCLLQLERISEANFELAVLINMDVANENIKFNATKLRALLSPKIDPPNYSQALIDYDWLIQICPDDPNLVSIPSAIKVFFFLINCFRVDSLAVFTACMHIQCLAGLATRDT